jgi:hypothetical protein
MHAGPQPAVEGLAFSKLSPSLATRYSTPRPVIELVPVS